MQVQISYIASWGIWFKKHLHFRSYDNLKWKCNDKRERKHFLTLPKKQKNPNDLRFLDESIESYEKFFPSEVEEIRVCVPGMSLITPASPERKYVNSLPISTWHNLAYSETWKNSWRWVRFRLKVHWNQCEFPFTAFKGQWLLIPQRLWHKIDLLIFCNSFHTCGESIACSELQCFGNTCPKTPQMQL